MYVVCVCVCVCCVCVCCVCVCVLWPTTHISGWLADCVATGNSTLSKLVPHCPTDALTAGLPAMLPGLFLAFNNSNADVRKAVVFCLVDMYMALGPVRISACLLSVLLLLSNLPRCFLPRHGIAAI